MHRTSIYISILLFMLLASLAGAAPPAPPPVSFFERIYEISFLIDLAKAIALLVGGWWILKVIVRILERNLSNTLTAQHIMLVSKSLVWGGMFVIALSVMHQLGFAMSTILGAAGIAGIAIGFAAQTSMSNLISGIFLIFEQPFQVGDIITVGTKTGIVMRIDLLSIKIRQFDNRLIRIPNEWLLKNEVVNVTHFPIRRVDIIVGIAYKEDLDKARDLLLKVADEHPKALADPEPIVVYQGFNASSQDLMLGVWVEKMDFLEVKNDVTKNIKRAFDDNNIEIPFPHLTIYAGSDSQPLPISVQHKDEKQVQQETTSD